MEKSGELKPDSVCKDMDKWLATNLSVSVSMHFFSIHVMTCKDV